MAKSTAATVSAYLKSLSPERRAAVQQVRQVILDNLPAGYEEQMLAGMLAYVVPLSRLAETYNGHPLMYAALASQKHYIALYVMSVYGHAETERWFRSQFKARGKKLDMGKSCVRFKTVDDLPLDVIGETIAKIPIDTWISVYQQSRTQGQRQPAATSKGTPASRAARDGRGTRAGAAKAR